MAIPEEIQYYEHEPNLGDLLFQQKAAQGDWSSTFHWFMRRTSLTEEEALDLTQDDMSKIVHEIGAAERRGMILRHLARELENA